MNRKFLLLLSLFIVAIGITGIFSNSGDDENNPIGNLVEFNKEKEVSIVLAQSTRTLSSGSILAKGDYALKKIMVPESSEWVKNDISKIENINRHLLRSNVLAESYITHEMLVSPKSHEFSRLILQKGEVIYKLKIKQPDEYLLDTLSVDDLLSFQLRTLETDQRKGTKNGISINTNEINDRKKQNYSLTEIIPDMRVIRIKKYSTSELSEINSKNQKTEDMSTGYIDVVISTEELELIHIAEKAGDIFLIPSINPRIQNYKSKNLHDILPKLHTIRELRG
ncbi:tight adherance operon protein [Yersinia mollaretii]|uniref:tight adherance operon protein n=1 Tax=Yersinia mollaretii TaxID=33060 RepID=UPI0011A9C4EB|nr:tight adherance operon protein [Yersinia mollaretii]